MQSLSRAAKYALAACLCLALLLGLLVPFDSPSAPQRVDSDLHFSLTDADRQTQVPQSARELDLDSLSGTVTLTGGDYLLRGSLNGALYIDAQDQVVHLYLDGASIRSAQGPAVAAVSGAKLIITSLPGTENLFRDSGFYSQRAEENACLYAACDLTLNGTGRLEVYGYHKDAVHCKDLLRIVEGDYRFQAKRDSARGNDGILVLGGSLLLEAEASCLHTTKTGKKGKGTVELLGGSLTLIAGAYGVEASGDVTVRDCYIYEKTVLGSFAAGGTMGIAEGCVEHG